jgi:hypothetical protein
MVLIYDIAGWMRRFNTNFLKIHEQGKGIITQLFTRVLHRLQGRNHGLLFDNAK